MTTQGDDGASRQRVNGGAMGRGSTGRAVGNALLNMAALGGLVCILLVVLSAFFSISLIMFKTGSMSPTIPAGSVAVVREIPASQIEVGDVLTVDRPGELPVTHRVTSVDGEGESRTITMRGDANDAEDPLPYTVTEARIVMLSVPHLAKVVVWFSNPWVLGALTLSASVLVTWAFWPRQRKGPRAPRRGAHGAGAGAGDERESRVSRAEDRTGAPVLAVTALAIGLAGSLLTPAGAEAMVRAPDDPVVIEGEHITLTSIKDADAMRTLLPGEPVAWQVGVRVDAPDPGVVEVSLEAAGSRDLGLNLQVRSCNVAWDRGVCPGEEDVLEGWERVDIGAPATPLTAMRAAEERWLMVTAMIPEPAAGMVALTVHASGGSDAVSTGPREVAPLPTTGAEPAWALGLVAVAAGLSAAGVASLARRRRTAGEP
ncbi:signal peptidase I [Leucobacter sp. USCH14]|uniref:signal peptidase I n=1 Tax=Leucobacter sp. USCH14 TaxID=3024838 RepID=UPI0030A072CB